MLSIIFFIVKTIIITQNSLIIKSREMKLNLNKKNFFLNRSLFFTMKPTMNITSHAQQSI